MKKNFVERFVESIFHSCSKKGYISQQQLLLPEYLCTDIDIAMLALFSTLLFNGWRLGTLLVG